MFNEPKWNTPTHPRDKVWRTPAERDIRPPQWSGRTHSSNPAAGWTYGTPLPKVGLADFGAPPNLLSVVIHALIKDSGSAASSGTWMAFHDQPFYQGSFSDVWMVACTGLANNAWAGATLEVPCASDGELYFRTQTSGTNTMTIWLTLLGWTYK